ncbi:DUF4387 domain-containing protein [Caballeronia sp. 15711]|uniref:DUF4387 domain-containing protein n=1 Tax=Caballeronia sp. 15711 TaxID=3391029 RepID=UPI0039E4664D
MSSLVPLKDIAKVVRSKNAGPFEITLDVIFANEADYRMVKNGATITADLISTLYRTPVEKICTFGFFDQINAIKITLPRPRPQGSVGETDMHACQQHMPLASVLIRVPDAYHRVKT